MAGIDNLIHQIIDRVLAERLAERHALVTSYDPKKYMGKVALQPEGTETGWLRIESTHIGSTYGMAFGLQPGSGQGQDQGQGGGGSGSGDFGNVTVTSNQNDGSQSGQQGQQGQGGQGQQGTTILHQILQGKPQSPTDSFEGAGSGSGSGGSSSGGSGDQGGQGQGQAQGDHVIVGFDVNDLEAGKIRSRVHSEVDKPPSPLNAGEGVIWTKFKQDKQSGPDAQPEGKSNSTGQKIYLKKDGTLTFEDGTGCVGVMDGNANYSLSSGTGNNSPQQLHFTSLNTQKGAKTSAFQGKHTTTWDQDGVTSKSKKAITCEAQKISHNGQVYNSQNVYTQGEDIAGQQLDQSDHRLKTKLAALPSVLAKVMSLRVKTFLKHYVARDEEGRGIVSPHPPKPSIGLIAQELQEVFPEAVHGDANKEFLSVSPTVISVLLLAAFQEFVTETRAEIAKMKEDYGG